MGLWASYSFRESWEVSAPRAQVAAVLLDLAHYPAWWPQVRAVASLGPDDAQVLCRSVLPYTLDLVLHAEHRSEERLEVSVAGDLAGRVCFRLAEVGGGTRLDFEQDVEVAGPMAALSRIGRPVLTWNHHRMMAGCRAGLAGAVSSAQAR